MRLYKIRRATKTGSNGAVDHFCFAFLSVCISPSDECGRAIQGELLFLPPGGIVAVFVTAGPTALSLPHG